MKTAFTLGLLLVIASSVSAEARGRCTDPRGIFGSAEDLQWEIRADFRTINDSNILLHEKERARSEGVLTSPEGSFRVMVTARGAFRYEECIHRPIGIAPIDKRERLKSPFNQDKLKLATICTSSPNWRVEETRNLLKEYTLYRMLRHLPGPMLEARLVSLRLVNPDGSLHLQAPAFVRESERSLAERCGLRERERVIKKWDNELRRSVPWLLMPDRSLLPYDYVTDATSWIRMELTNRFLNNIDYVEELDHNVIPLVPIDRSDRRIFVVPYDYDLSQAAGGTYYSFTGTPAENAKQVVSWLQKEGKHISDGVKAGVVDEFLAAFPSMADEIASSPLDAQGKADLIAWLSAHREALSRFTLR